MFLPAAFAHGHDRADGIIQNWFFVAPLLAGLLRLKYARLVPMGAAMALLITQPLVGATWRSILRNEGLIILIFVLPLLMAYFLVGWFVRFVFDFVKRPPR